MYDIPAGLEGYNFDAKTAGNIGNVEFYGSILKYIGEKMDLVVIGEPPMITEEEVELDEQKEQKEDKKESSETGKPEDTDKQRKKPEGAGTETNPQGTEPKGTGDKTSGNDSGKSSGQTT